MNDVKLRLSLCVPGAQMLSKQECLKNPKETHEVSKINVVFKAGKGRNAKTKKETLIVKTRKSRAVKQNINITTASYYYMISPTEIPLPKYAKVVGRKSDGTPIFLWSRMKVQERLKVHLDLIAEHFNACGYTYEILDD